MAREVGSVSSDCFCGRFGSEDGKVIHLIDLQRKDLHRSSYREETGQTSKICRKVSNFWAPCPTLERKTVRVLSQCTRKSRSRSGSPRAVFVSSALIIRHKFGAQCVNPRNASGRKEENSAGCSPPTTCMCSLLPPQRLVPISPARVPGLTLCEKQMLRIWVILRMQLRSSRGKL